MIRINYFIHAPEDGRRDGLRTNFIHDAMREFFEFKERHDEPSREIGDTLYSAYVSKNGCKIWYRVSGSENADDFSRWVQRKITHEKAILEIAHAFGDKEAVARVGERLRLLYQVWGYSGEYRHKPVVVEEIAGRQIRLELSEHEDGPDKIIIEGLNGKKANGGASHDKENG